jgi:hypothetical protein
MPKPTKPKKHQVPVKTIGGHVTEEVYDYFVAKQYFLGRSISKGIAELVNHDATLRPDGTPRRQDEYGFGIEVDDDGQPMWNLMEILVDPKQLRILEDRWSTAEYNETLVARGHEPVLIEGFEYLTFGPTNIRAKSYEEMKEIIAQQELQKEALATESLPPPPKPKPRKTEPPPAPSGSEPLTNQVPDEWLKSFAEEFTEEVPENAETTQ